MRYSCRKMDGMGQCSQARCEKPAQTRGWCKRHYDRWLRSGSPDFPEMTDPLTTVLARTRKEGECLVWDGPTTDPQGRGQVRYGGRPVRAHVVVWTLTRGAVPQGQVIRHTCDVAACLNIEHMLLGTQADNMRDLQERGRGRWAMCRNGLHRLEGDNLYEMPSQPG